MQKQEAITICCADFQCYAPMQKLCGARYGVCHGRCVCDVVIYQKKLWEGTGE